MIDQRDVAALLADPARAVDVPVGDVRALLDAVSAQAARLDVVKSILAARLSARNGTGHADSGDRWLTAEEVAQRTDFSVDYIYRHAGRFPFTRRQGRTLRFSETGLVRWMARQGR